MEHVAIDIGASGGTVLAGSVTDDELRIETVHRFDNQPVQLRDRYVWDIDALVSSIQTGLSEAAAKGGAFDTVGVDTWAVDFGLYDADGLIRDPYAYRDPAVAETLDDILDVVSKREIFEATGINHWNVPNTLWQYHALARTEPDVLAETETILMIPQVLSAALGGDRCAEETVASTTQLFDPRPRTWADSLFEALELPMDPLPEIRETGSTIGTLDSEAVADFESPPEIVLPASHDTAAAVAALPLSDGKRTFLSTGSWFIAGVELDEPVLTDEAFAFGASNELGVADTVRFLKNVNGFFLLEECRKRWREEGGLYEYDTLVSAAREADRGGPLVDPDDDRLTIEGPMPENVATFCRETGQDVPNEEGAIARSLFESLAVKTAMTVERIESIAGLEGDVLSVGGGGVRNDLFLEMLASALDRPVRTGPVEATAVGNIVTQGVARGEIDDIQHGRDIVRTSVDSREYEPTDVAYFERRREAFETVLEAA